MIARIHGCMVQLVISTVFLLIPLSPPFLEQMDSEALSSMGAHDLSAPSAAPDLSAPALGAPGQLRLKIGGN